jgi:hypothetical protein
MSALENVERAKASREALEAVAKRGPRGPVSNNLDAALKKYLAAEQYHQRTSGDQRRDGGARKDTSEP